MGLVTYSDSEGSDSEPVVKNTPVSSGAPASKSTKGPGFQPLVERGNNRRKIVVDLKDNKTDDGKIHGDGDGEDDGPARKRPRIGGGGGLFAGFNAMLPPPKRKTAAPKELEKKAKDSSRPAFSLKTSATPGFVRGGDEELTQGSFNEYGDAVNGAAASDAPSGTNDLEKKEEEVVIKKGNAMMFKPLSVSRNKPRKKAAPMATKSEPKSSNAERPSNTEKAHAIEQKQNSAPPPKPKVSLFGLSSNDSTAASSQSQTSSLYEPLIYTHPSEPAAPGPQPQYENVDTSTPFYENEQTSTSNNSQSLTSIANDLNLSKSEMRQLLGRKGQAALDNTGPSNASPRILTFNTDEEYRSNSAYLYSASEAELAAQQHNPIRSIAPGKHSLQQLVNAVSNQREALEESFVAGKRNKKEAGSKYGW